MGWSQGVRDAVMGVFFDIAGAKYEIENCVKGARTGARTNEELGAKLVSLAERLKSAGEQVKAIPEWN